MTFESRSSLTKSLLSCFTTDHVLIKYYSMSSGLHISHVSQEVITYSGKGIKMQPSTQGSYCPQGQCQLSVATMPPAQLSPLKSILQLCHCAIYKYVLSFLVCILELYYSLFSYRLLYMTDTFFHDQRNHNISLWQCSIMH